MYRKYRRQPTKLDNKHHHSGGPFAPPTACDLLLGPIRHKIPLPKVSAKGALAGISINRYFNHVCNLFVLLLVIFTNFLPAVDNGGRKDVTVSNVIGGGIPNDRNRHITSSTTRQ